MGLVVHKNKIIQIKGKIDPKPIGGQEPKGTPSVKKVKNLGKSQGRP